MAPASPAALWTHDQVRRLIIEAAESAPLSAGERRQAWAALHMVRDAMGELFGPLASIGDPDGVPSYEREAEAIVAGLQRVAHRLKAIAPSSDAPKGSEGR